MRDVEHCDSMQFRSAWPSVLFARTPSFSSDPDLMLYSRFYSGVCVAVLLLACVSCDRDADGPAGERQESVTQDALDTPAGADLDAARQKHIWDVEHYAFEIETRFGRPFMQQLADGDSSSLLSWFREGFQGSLGLESGETIEHPLVTEVARQRETSDGQDASVERSEFVAGLLESSAIFAEIERTRLRVLQLDNVPDDPEHWKATLLTTLHGKDAEGKFVVQEAHHDVSFRISDAMKIGEMPIVDCWGQVDSKQRTSGQPLFEEVTEEVGLDTVALVDNWKIPSEATQQYWSQLAVEDFDRDGDLDIAAASFLGQPFLLQSEGGQSFSDVAKSMGLKAWPINDSYLVNLAVWIDYDNDSFPDLLLGSRLYHNVEGQRFVDVTTESGLFIDHHPMGGVVADYDCDGLLDLYLLYEEPTEWRPELDGPQGWVGDAQSGALNRLWRNEGNGRFRDVTETSGAGGGYRRSFAAVWHFMDEDRYPDLYIANDFGSNVHLRNRGDGTFEDVSKRTGVSDFATSMGAAAGDIDNDGYPEIYVANMYSKMGRRIIAHVHEDDYPPGVHEQILGSCAGNRLYQRTADAETFEDVTDKHEVNAVGWAYAPAFADFDSDGWLDIYATTGFMSFSRTEPDG